MKNSFNMVALAVFAICLLSVADSLRGFLESKLILRGVSGSTLPLSGNLDALPPELEALNTNFKAGKPLGEMLELHADSPFLYMEFLELDGRMWRGVLRIPDGVPVGEYHFTVERMGVTPTPESRAFLLKVFSDNEALLKDFPSIAFRLVGLQPWWITLATLPLGIALFYLAWMRSGEEEIALQARGMGEIYRLAKRKREWEVLFGLGRKHGVATGDELLLLNAKRQPVGRLRVTQADYESSTSTVPLDQDIKAGYLVAKPDSVTSMMSH